MSITWIVQDNLGSTSSTADSIKLACENEEQPYVPIQLIPFSNELPKMPEVDGKFVLYGRTTLMLNAYSDDFWKNGLFFNPDFFTPECYKKHWGDMMLNSDAFVVKLRDIPKIRSNELSHMSLDSEFFIRPNDDLKLFQSGVVTLEDLIKMPDNATDDPSEPVNLNTEISISSVKNIDREWRLIIVDKKFISGSEYIPEVKSFVPAEVIDFAEKAAEIWTPAPVFVMDIAFDGSSFKIIECNCFNGSGFYASDLDLIVRVVSKYVEFS
jgi:hypothetical protein